MIVTAIIPIILGIHNIQPVRFFMDSHINEGKEELNFNEFGNYSKRKNTN